MYSLDEILDEVREKYYKSKYLKRPTISWTKDFVTSYFGVYNFHDNHIFISRIFNTDKVSRKMVEAIVYHESLHQDYQKHNKAFENKMSRVPDYLKIEKKLNDFAAKTHNELNYEKRCNNFTEGKERIIYIVLSSTQYVDAFIFRNGSFVVDFEAEVNFNPNENDLYIFLVEYDKNYYIVGWCTSGILFKQKQIKNHRKFGDYNYKYQFKGKRENTFIIPELSCSYSIAEDLLPKELIKNKCFEFDSRDDDIQPDIEYIECYCEGFEEKGYDIKAIDMFPTFENIPVDQVKKLNKTGYQKINLLNAVYHKEPTIENLKKRAVEKYKCWLLDSSLEDFIKADNLAPNDIDTAFDIIKISVLSENYNLAQKYMNKYKNILPKDVAVLNNLYKEIEANVK